MGNRNRSLSDRADRMSRSRSGGAPDETDVEQDAETETKNEAVEEVSDTTAENPANASEQSEADQTLAPVSDYAGMGHGAGEYMTNADTAGRTLYLGEDILSRVDQEHKNLDAEFMAAYGEELPKHAFYRVLAIAGLEQTPVRTLLGLDD